MPLPLSFSEHIREWGAAAFAAFVLFLSITALPLVSLWVVFPGTLPTIWYATLAVSFGELVGFSEIITRYRDEPLRATFNRYGILYLLINGALSGCAYFLLRAYGARIFPAAQDPPLLAAIVAGFGAMAVLRSKLFVFRSDDGKDIPIGPDLVISSVLRIVDRKIDRLRAARRQQLVFELAKRIAAVMGSESDFDNPNSFVSISLASFQNLSTEEKQQIVIKSEELREKLKGKPSLFKAMVLGFVVLDIAGEENFRAIMQDLEEYLRSIAPVKPISGSGRPTGPPSGA
ncbi:MAG: hypothetical protein LAO56_12010 [Acidobacteriia bacterium]|nr:hypothetical protein [Terriglobia bacterium]